MRWLVPLLFSARVAIGDLARTAPSIPLTHILIAQRNATFGGIEMDDPLTYLPPGWTEETWKTYPQEEVEKLSPEEHSKIRARMKAQMKKTDERMDAVALAREQQMEERMIARGEQPLKRVGPKEYDLEMPALVRLLDLKRTDEWGFLVLWTATEAKTNETVKRIIEQLPSISTSRLHTFGAHPRIDEVEAEVNYVHIVDDRLKGAPRETLEGKYDELEEDNRLPHAIMHDFALILDDEALQSFSLDTSEEAPFLNALDMGWSPNNNYDPTYEGHFKVAVTALPDFYATTNSRGHSGLRLFRMSQKTGIWKRVEA